eukprot:6995213-Prymnesium_polylepis.2
MACSQRALMLAPRNNAPHHILRDSSSPSELVQPRNLPLRRHEPPQQVRPEGALHALRRDRSAEVAQPILALDHARRVVLVRTAQRGRVRARRPLDALGRVDLPVAARRPLDLGGEALAPAPLSLAEALRTREEGGAVGGGGATGWAPAAERGDRRR